MTVAMQGTTGWYDYSLNGPQTEIALRSGLASAEWYKCNVDRKTMKQLMKRSDAAGIRHFSLWLLLLVGTGVLAYMSWGTWWAIPAFFLLGSLEVFENQNSVRIVQRYIE